MSLRLLPCSAFPPRDPAWCPLCVPHLHLPWAGPRPCCRASAGMPAPDCRHPCPARQPAGPRPWQVPAPRSGGSCRPKGRDCSALPPQQRNRLPTHSGLCLALDTLGIRPLPSILPASAAAAGFWVGALFGPPPSFPPRRDQASPGLCNDPFPSQDQICPWCPRVPCEGHVLPLQGVIFWKPTLQASAPRPVHLEAEACE